MRLSDTGAGVLSLLYATWTFEHTWIGTGAVLSAPCFRGARTSARAGCIDLDGRARRRAPVWVAASRPNAGQVTCGWSPMPDNQGTQMTIHFAFVCPSVGAAFISDTAVSRLSGGIVQRINSAQKVFLIGERTAVAFAGDGDLAMEILEDMLPRLDESPTFDSAVAGLQHSYRRVALSPTELGIEAVVLGRTGRGRPRFKLSKLWQDPTKHKLLRDEARRMHHACIGFRATEFSAELCAWLSENNSSIPQPGHRDWPQFSQFMNRIGGWRSPRSFFLSCCAGGLFAAASELAKEQGWDQAVGGPWHELIMPSDAPAHFQEAVMYNGERSILPGCERSDVVSGE